MTPLSKKVVRRSDASMIRYKGRLLPLVIVVYPNGTVGLRPYGTRQEETIGLDAIYSFAIKARVAAEQAKRKADKKGKRK